PIFHCLCRRAGARWRSPPAKEVEREYGYGCRSATNSSLSRVVPLSLMESIAPVRGRCQNLMLRLRGYLASLAERKRHKRAHFHISGISMKHSLRHGQLLSLLEREGTISIGDLADHFGVSQETVRRDVKLLAARGALVRMHGAVALPSVVGEAPFEKRMNRNRDAKEAIARLAASTIANGQSIMVDTGTTTSYLARALLEHRRLT